MQIESAIGESAVVAILRGVQPARVVEIAGVLRTEGIRIIEVPLNSPDPFGSIAALVAAQGSDCLIGAGTVLDLEAVRRTYAAGGRLIVAPNCDADVIRGAVQMGMQVMPGIATATEAFSAIRAGATQLKLFPAVTYGPRHLQALRAVLPANVRVFPVGGVGAAEIPGWLAAGAAGFGFGSELFRPEYDLPEIERRARQLVQALRTAHQR
ncbi:MAG: 2-dehydro-3-deoxy-6-phosphogalactonate aldolase [Gammaproteobacteria bacterium]|nr:2-dehydro-3-deoxy-6-phosphogalactonate aldolase [Gammaproteobacteria bacterium]